jgi:hypothetical protein
MRASQPAAGLHTGVVPSRWFAHHLDRPVTDIAEASRDRLALVNQAGIYACRLRRELACNSIRSTICSAIS